MYDNLRTIGCLCYATITGPKPDRFALRTRRCVFLGYPPGQKGYKFYDLKTRTTFLSRDVIFKETEFPFKDRKHIPIIHTKFSPSSFPIKADTESTLIPPVTFHGGENSHVINDTTSSIVFLFLLLLLLLQLHLQLDPVAPPVVPPEPRRSQRVIK